MVILSEYRRANNFGDISPKIKTSPVKKSHKNIPAGECHGRGRIPRIKRVVRWLKDRLVRVLPTRIVIKKYSGLFSHWLRVLAIFWWWATIFLIRAADREVRAVSEPDQKADRNSPAGRINKSQGNLSIFVFSPDGQTSFFVPICSGHYNRSGATVRELTGWAPLAGGCCQKIWPEFLPGMNW